MSNLRRPGAPTAAREPDPIVESIGLAKHPRGWVVVLITTQGDKVLSKEVVSRDPEAKAHAAMRAQTEIVKHFVASKEGVGA